MSRASRPAEEALTGVGGVVRVAATSSAPGADAGSGLPELPAPFEIGPRAFAWGERTFVMGILNVTPDSFSGDGLLVEAGGRAVDLADRAVAIGRAMAEAGADILDIGGESTRPGHDPTDPTEETRRVMPVIAALHDALPDMPLSVDTTKPPVAEAALAAGAHLVNDVWGVTSDDALARVAAAHGAPLVLTHNRAEARYTNLVAEVLADLEAAIERALRAGMAWERLIVDPGFGFGKTAEHNLALLRNLEAVRLLGRPVLLGTSRKSTLGKVLDLPVGDRLEATLATTALGIAAGVDIVRVHDVLPNVRAARMSDAIIRGSWRPRPIPSEGGSP